MPVINDDDVPEKRIELKFTTLPDIFAVAKLPAGSPVPDWAAQGPFTSITRTPEELSIVCPADNLPREVNSESHWICLKLQGPFAFSETGILASFIGPLSADAIPIFAISIFNTDYVLIKEEFWGAAHAALQNAGHEFLAGN